MSPEQAQLWKSVQAFSLDAPGAAYGFTDRLAFENRWPIDYALAAVLEYKRFMFLVALGPDPLTPSAPVDQVWHLHLLYTRSYWEGFCQGVLGKAIHHGPTQGGPSEDLKFAGWYQRTLDRYAELFRQKPPADFWPDPSSAGPAPKMRWFDNNAHWLIRKPKFLRP